MHAPQIIIIVLQALGLGIALQQHGQPKTGKHNFGTMLVATCINFGLLYWGGFFSK